MEDAAPTHTHTLDMRVADTRLVLCVFGLLVVAPAAGVPARGRQNLAPDLLEEVQSPTATNVEPARGTMDKFVPFSEVPTQDKQAEESTKIWPSVLASNVSLKVGTWGRAPAMAEFAAATEVAESRRGTVLRLECGLWVMVE